jgi:hypothetical protein
VWGLADSVAIFASAEGGTTAMGSGLMEHWTFGAHPRPAWTKPLARVKLCPSHQRC